MKRIVVIILFVSMILICPFFARATQYEELPGSELAEELIESTPEDAKKLVDELGIDELTPEKLLSLDPSSLVSMLLNYVADCIVHPVKSIGAVMAIIIICAVAEVFRPSAQSTLGGVFSVVSAVAVSAVLVSAAIESIHKVSEAARDFSGFMVGYVPIFASAVTASGYTASGGVYSGFMFLVCQFISGISSHVLLPLLSIYLAVSLVGGINPELKINGVANAFKTCFNKILGFLLTVFVGMMSIQTLVATGSDNLAVRAGKYLIGNFVPMVGSAISEVFLSVQGCMKLMKTCIGWYGIIAAVLIFLPIIAETVVWRIAIYLADVTAQILNVSNASTALNAVGSVFTMLISVILTFAMLLIVSTTIMLITGMG